MAGLATEYSKQIARELTKIAVYLPGTGVKPGDLVEFPMGRSGLLRRPKPYGALEVIGNLGEMGIDIGQPTVDADPDPYIFATRGGSNVSFVADAGGNVGGGANARGTLSVRLTKENSLYFAAVDCRTSRLTNITRLERALEGRRDEVGADRAYLVLSTTSAAKALVMQASSSSADLEVKGEVKGLMPGAKDSPIDASASVMVSRFSSASLIKPWSDNVTVFVGLAKLSRRRNNADERVTLAETPRSRTSDGDLEIVAVSPHEFVPEDE